MDPIVRRPGRLPLRLLLLVAALATTLMGWCVGLLIFVAGIPREAPDLSTRTDAIVVLTGGVGRLETGLDLLSRELGSLLFVSGVHRGTDVRTLLRLARTDFQPLAARIEIGDALDTEENAVETAQWMSSNDFHSLRLVTGGYHMPRSLMEFGWIMPDIVVLPHPVFSDHVKLDRWWAWPGTAALVIGEYNKFLLAWLGHAASLVLTGEG